jgi:osmotically inducible protein OsmC
MDRGATTISTGARAAGTDAAGTLTTDSGALINMPFSLKARYELEATPSGTTPEELLAAACATCFTEELSSRLAAAGHKAQSLQCESRVQLVRAAQQWTISGIRIHCTAVVPGISDSEFLSIVHESKVGGPIAQALRPEITVTVSRLDHPLTAEAAMNPSHRQASRW